jgi:two-component system sensor histidine kinase CpxA
MIALIGMGMVSITHPPMPMQPLSLHLPQLSACVARALQARDPGDAKQIAAQCGVVYIQDGGGHARLGAQAGAEVHALAGQVTTEAPLGLRPIPKQLMIAFAVPIGTLPFVAVAILPNQPPALPPMLWWQLLAATLVSAMSCLLLTRHLVDPIRKLQLCTEAFGRGKLDSRPDSRLLRRNDELGELSLTIGQMSDRISRLMASQKDFLIQVSHELGSPLTRLNVALALARRKAPASLRPEFDRIQYESTELNSMVQQLLRLARFESGLERQGQEFFSLHELMLEVCYDNELVANESHKQLQLVSSVQVHFWGYRELLKRAMDNVLRNAIRFTPEGSRVELFAGNDPDGQTVLIQVRDRGPGVQPDKLDSIFEPFVRGSSDRTGAGLGLAIAKRAVMANRGTIRASNLAEGGLLVEIKLPSAPGEVVSGEEAAAIDLSLS